MAEHLRMSVVSRNQESDRPTRNAGNECRKSFTVVSERRHKKATIFSASEFDPVLIGKLKLQIRKSQHGKEAEPLHRVTSFRKRISLDEAPAMYKDWRDKAENATKIVIDPWLAGVGRVEKNALNGKLLDVCFFQSAGR
jgi:hypothetical protein